MKVTVGIPAGTMLHTEFALCLANMMVRTYRERPEVEASLYVYKSSMVPLSRNKIAEYAIESGAKYLMFIDSDMEFPADGLLRLLNEAEAGYRDVIGANYIKRGLPFNSLTLDLEGKEISKAKWVVEVSRLPTGFMLIDTAILLKLSKPWFTYPINGETLVSEDYAFCDVVRKAGFKLWMDAELSEELVHWGASGVRWVQGGYKHEF